MNTVALVIGYAFMVVCAAFALAYAYEVLLRNLWKRCIDSEDFYKCVVAYAKVRRHTRKSNRVGPADE